MKSKILVMNLLILVSNHVFSQESLSQDNANSGSADHLITVEENIDIHVVDWGGSGEALLFLPSWASTAHVYDGFAPRFTDKFHVLVMDMRGHGLSSRPESGYTIDRLTEDINVVLEKQNIKSVHLVALSRSASLTTQFAARYPDKVSSLIYLSGPIDREFARQFYAKPDNQAAAKLRNNAEVAVWKACNVPPDKKHPPGSFDEAADDVGIEWRDSDPSPPYEKVKAPAIAFWQPIRGEIEKYREYCDKSENQQESQAALMAFSEAVPALYPRMDHDMEMFSQQLTNSRIVEIPGAQYHTYITHPNLVEREMRQFLENLK